MIHYQIKIILAFALVMVFVTPSIASIASASTLPAARQNLDESVNRLIEERDSDSVNNLSEQNNITNRKKVISDVLALSRQEIESVRARLNAARIDRESQLWTVRKIILQWLDSEEKYFKEIEDRLSEELSLNEVKDLAREIQNHRNEKYNANLANALDFIFALRTLRLTDIASNRWDRINSDLQRIERAGLIRVNLFTPEMSEARAMIDKARLLVEKSLVQIENIYLPTPEEKPTPLVTEVSDDTTIENKQIAPTVRELCETAIDNLKTGYDAFVRISVTVRRLLRLP